MSAMSSAEHQKRDGKDSGQLAFAKASQALQPSSECPLTFRSCRCRDIGRATSG